MALTKLELAKSKIALHAGVFISLTSKLEWIPDESIPTACTDGRKAWYNPTWFNSLTLSQAIGIVLHETGHNMLAHPARIGERNHDVAGIAMDIVLNRLLLKYFDETRLTLNAELPPGGLFGPEFDVYDGWNWEKIYADLMQKVQKQGGVGGKGEGSNGVPKKHDDVKPATGPDGKRLSEAEADALAKEWTMAAQQAATMAKTRGKMPGFLEEFIAEQVAPKVDWRSQVWDAFTKTAKEDQSWRRLNRRYAHKGLYLPGRYSEHLSRVGTYVDTSGSMGSNEFKLAMGCINEVFEDLKPEQIVFVQCDTRICSEETLTPDDLPLAPRKFKGRGGTMLTPMFEHQRRLDEDLDLMVVITDGYHEEIDKSLEPNCPMVWIVTTDSTRAAEKSFGRVIKVEV